MSATSQHDRGRDRSVAVALDRALLGMAVGRLLLATGSLLAPQAMARALRATPSAELTYMTRIFGGRALALGAGYLASHGPDRRRWHRLALVVDVSDTAAGLVHVARRDMPAGSAGALTALTGTYAVLGAARAITQG